MQQSMMYLTKNEHRLLCYSNQFNEGGKLFSAEVLWAGSPLSDYSSDSLESEEAVQDFLDDLEKKFDVGIIQSVHGVEMKLEVLCVNVYRDGKLHRLHDFK
jgi:hypothetical protein